MVAAIETGDDAKVRFIKKRALQVANLEAALSPINAAKHYDLHRGNANQTCASDVPPATAKTTKKDKKKEKKATAAAPPVKVGAVGKTTSSLLKSTRQVIKSNFEGIKKPSWKITDSSVETIRASFDMHTRRWKTKAFIVLAFHAASQLPEEKAKITRQLLLDQKVEKVESGLPEDDILTIEFVDELIAANSGGGEIAALR